MPDAVDTVVCAPDDGWKYHPKHVEQFPDVNKLCDVATCWIYDYIGILLGTRPILHISRIKVKPWLHESAICVPAGHADNTETSKQIITAAIKNCSTRNIRKYFGTVIILSQYILH
jgi:hypothetical protein